jgi:hypothetical protein
MRLAMCTLPSAGTAAEQVMGKFVRAEWKSGRAAKDGRADPIRLLAQAQTEVNVMA